MKHILFLSLLGMAAISKGQTINTFPGQLGKPRHILVLPSGKQLDMDSAWMMIEKAATLSSRLDSALHRLEIDEKIAQFNVQLYNSSMAKYSCTVDSLLHRLDSLERCCMIDMSPGPAKKTYSGVNASN